MSSLLMLPSEDGIVERLGYGAADTSTTRRTRPPSNGWENQTTSLIQNLTRISSYKPLISLEAVVKQMVEFGSIITALVAGAIGGFLAKLSWKYWQRPKLNLGPSVTTAHQMGLSNDMKSSLKKEGEVSVHSAALEVSEIRNLEYTYYRIEVTNTGRTAASNCKPTVNLCGVQKIDGKDNPTAKYLIEYSSFWLESEHPSRITINSGETAVFDLLRRKPEDEGFIEFPSENGWDDKTPITMHHDQVGSTPLHSFDVTALIDTEWEQNSLEVTAENARKVRGYLEFSLVDGRLSIEIKN